MSMTNTNNIAARQEYDQARRMFYLAYRDKFAESSQGDAKCLAFVNSLELTQGEIRLEVELNATNNIFTWGVTPNQANTNNILFRTEKRLPLQDSICCTELQMYVWLPRNSASTPDVEGTNSLLRTYGNTQDFTAASALAIDSTLYSHGNFTFKRNNKVLVPYRGLQNWWNKPQTQQTAALGAGSPGDQIEGASYGMVTSTPNLVLIGSSNNIPQIELPGNMASVDEFTRFVLIGKGPYAQNSTVVN